MGYLYRHIRLDTNEVFYIGIGGFSKYEKEYSYSRSFTKRRRNKYWKYIVDKTDYVVEIMLEGLKWEEACEKEKEFIKLYGRRDLGTGTLSNMTDGGDGLVGRICSDETRKKLSEINKGKKCKPTSNETRKKLSEANKGKKRSSETKGKLSEIRKGKIPWIKGKKHTKQSNEKNRQKHLGKIPWNKGLSGVQNAWNKGLKGMNKGWNNVIVIIDGIEYKSITEASIGCGISRTTISNRCKSDKFKNYNFKNA